MKKEIGQKIKMLRKSHGLTIFQLHEILGVCSTTISKWENGKSLIKTKNVIKIAKFFNVKINYLLCLED